MSSELRVNKLTSRSGVGTVSFNDSGLIITGIATAAVLDITGSATAASLSITGNATLGSATISGVLSYDDVTNVDSVGIVTAAGGVDTNTIRGKTNDSNVAFGARASNGAHVISLILKPDRTATFDGDISIADKIIHTGDTNTAIRFPAADTITAETSGTERLRITSAGNIGIGTNNPQGKLTVSNGSAGLEFNPNSEQAIVSYNRATSAYTPVGLQGSVVSLRIGGLGEALRIDSSGRLLVGSSVVQAYPNMDDLQLGDGSGNRGMTISSGTSNYGTIAFGDSTDGSGTDRYSGYIEYYHGDNSFRFATLAAERLRIDSSGSIGISSTAPKTDVDISQKTGAVALPQGTTAQRPSGNAPYIRKNTTNSALEFYNGTNWVEIITDYFPTGSTTLG